MKAKLWSILCLLVLSTSLAAQTWSGVYVGGHIRRQRPSTITKLKESGFTYVLLFNVSVETDGTLTSDGETICKGGKYVWAETQPYYVEDIRSLKEPPTAINRIDIVIGGWGNESYSRIRDIINANPGDKLKRTDLYRNFEALKEAIPEIDGVNNDDEHCYDLATAVQFHTMMFDLGYKTTLAPYMWKAFWEGLANQLNQNRSGACDHILIQCYDGGAYNNPSDWHIGNIPLLAGRTNYQSDMQTSLDQMEAWRDGCNVVGGFVWVYNDESWNLKNWASGMNRIFAANVKGVARVYATRGKKGYSVSLPVGRYTAGQLTAYGIAETGTGNNYREISSIELEEGYQLTAYYQGDFTGVNATWQASSDDLGARWRNRIASLVVEPIPTGIAATIQNTCNDYEVYDMAGRRLKQAGSEDALQSLPRGTYVVRHAGTSHVVVWP